MVGPLLVHQKKEKLSFKLLVDFLVDQESRLKNLRALGTDGETAISLAFKERCVFLLVLFCAIHLRRNVTDKMVALGIEESERREICADIFGVQVGSQLQEGIIDADDEEPDTDEVDVAIEDLFVQPRVLQSRRPGTCLRNSPFLYCGRSVEES